MSGLPGRSVTYLRYRSPSLVSSRRSKISWMESVFWFADFERDAVSEAGLRPRKLGALLTDFMLVSRPVGIEKSPGLSHQGLPSWRFRCNLTMVSSDDTIKQGHEQEAPNHTPGGFRRSGQIEHRLARHRSHAGSRWCGNHRGRRFEGSDLIKWGTGCLSPPAPSERNRQGSRALDAPVSN